MSAPATAAWLTFWHLYQQVAAPVCVQFPQQRFCRSLTVLFCHDNVQFVVHLCVITCCQRRMFVQSHASWKKKENNNNKLKTEPKLKVGMEQPIEQH